MNSLFRQASSALVVVFSILNSSPAWAIRADQPSPCALSEGDETFFQGLTQQAPQDPSTQAATKPDSRFTRLGCQKAELKESWNAGYSQALSGERYQLLAGLIDPHQRSRASTSETDPQACSEFKSKPQAYACCQAGFDDGALRFGEKLKASNAARCLNAYAQGKQRARFACDKPRFCQRAESVCLKGCFSQGFNEEAAKCMGTAAAKRGLAFLDEGLLKTGLKLPGEISGYQATLELQSKCLGQNLKPVGTPTSTPNPGSASSAEGAQK